MTAHEALLEIVEERSLTVKAGDVAGHQFHGNQYTAEVVNKISRSETDKIAETYRATGKVLASIPGNRHAAADYSGDSMADRMREHDAIRTNTAISDPHQYMAHTASIAAYQATKDIKAGKVVHAEAAAAHDVAAKLHRALGNGEYADKHERHADYHRSK